MLSSVYALHANKDSQASYLHCKWLQSSSQPRRLTTLQWISNYPCSASHREMTHDFESDFTEFETKLQGQLLTRLLFKFLLHYFMNKSLFFLVEKGKPYLMLGRSWFGRSCVKLYSWIPWNFASRNVSTANSPQENLTDPMNKFYHVWNWKVFWKRIKESLWPTWSSRYEIFCELAISSLAQKLAL